MEPLGKEEELLIQKMIDGQLLAEEIEKFEKLISSSPAARKLYSELVKVNTTLIADAQNTKQINFSKEIMQRVKALNIIRNTKRNKKKSSVLFFSSKQLAFSAVLIIGLLTGALTTFLLNQQIPETKYNRIAGTMAANQTDEYYYNKSNTEIKVQEFHFEQLKFTIISVNTTENIQCIISKKSGLSEKNIVLLSSNGKFKKLNDNDKNIYEFAGKTILQIYRTSEEDLINPVDIQFLKNNKKIKSILLN